MIKTFTRFTATAIVLLLAGYQSAFSSHITGSDVTYRCLGGNQYQVIFTVYRDCSGISMSTSLSVEITSNCGTQTVTASQDPANSGIDVSALCPTATSTCAGGSYPGIQVYTYIANVTLDPLCGPYTFGYSECCRNSNNNLLNGTTQVDGWTDTAYLATSTLCNSSPIFTSLPVPYFCVNQSVNYSAGAFDPDGDSLVYTLVAPLNDVGVPIQYMGGLSPTNPLPNATGFGFDPQTGQMTFRPTQAGAYVVDVLVQEYRNGVLIGTCIRDIQIVIINCNNTSPIVQWQLTNANTTGGVLVDSNSIGICPGEHLTFTVNAYDPGGQAITVTSNVATSIPGATLTTTNIGGPDSVSVTFDWIPSGTDSGYRYFTIEFRDNACPIPGIQLFTYDITVLRGIDAGPDRYYCTGGGPVLVSVTGGNHFSWNNTSGMVAANSDSSLVYLAPSQTTTYVIESDLLGNCKRFDTLTVFNVQTFSNTITTPDDTICLNSSTTLNITSNPSTEGPFSYTWGPLSQGVISPNASSTVVRPLNTTWYQVTAVSAAGCTIRDSFQVVIQGVGPKVIIVPSDDYVCPGDQVQLNTLVSALSCGGSSDPLNPCLPGSTFELRDLGTATTTATTNTTPYIGLWEDGRVQYLYRASELQAMGLGAGTFTDLAFNVTAKNSTQPYGSFTIKMGCTGLDELPTSFVTAGLTTVVNPNSYTTTLGWNTHTFDTPYDWDGFSNLIVEVCYDNNSWTSSDNVSYTATAFANSVLFDDADLPTSSGCTALNTPTRGQNRPNTRFIMCKAPLFNYSFNWSPTLPDTSAPSASVYTDGLYSVTVSDGTCEGDTSIMLHVDSATLISAGPDVALCNGQDTIQLNAEVLHPAAMYCIPSYTLATIPYSPRTPTGVTIAGPSGDDIVSAAIPIPFPFEFFCNSVTQFFISTNGFVTFSTGQGSGCCSGQAIPNAAAPNNLIALCWEDLNTNSGGNIDFFVNGTAPNRVGVVRFNNVAYFGGGGVVNGQIQVYETTNVIEVHLGSVTNPNQINTTGIENATGTVAYSPLGYNSSGWTVNTPIAFRYTPQTAGNSLVGNMQWTPSSGLSTTNSNSPFAFPDTTTTYIVSATFSNGCVTHDTITVGIGNFPYTVSTVPDSICYGDSAQLAFNGNGVSYTWTPDTTLSSGSVSSPLATPLQTTTYHVLAFDSIGCRVEDSVTVAVRTHAPISLGNDSTTCPTDSLILLPDGGPYTSYLWSTGETTNYITTANQINNPQPYWVLVNDGYCFYNSDTVSISEFVLPPIVVNPSGDTTICTGTVITLSAPPGYVSYVWSNSPQQTQTITIGTAGAYSYTVTDNNGCVITSSDTAFVSVAPQPAADILVDNLQLCEGQTVATLTVNPQVGIVYIWNPGSVVADTFVASVAGTYTLIASNNGCLNTDTVTITSVTPPVLDLGPDQSFCGCDTGTVLTTNVIGNYLWSTNDTTAFITATATGSYSMTVTDENTCTATDVVDVVIRCLEVNAIVADPTTGTVFIGRNAYLDAQSSYSSTFTYSWSPSTYLDDSTDQSPYVSAPQNTTTYFVTVTDTEYGCVATDSVTLAVVPPGIPPMPTAFTPNGDGVNDTYGPFIPAAMQGIYTVSQFRIYNRWGAMVYNATPDWDGNFNNVPQPAGVYVYYITIQGPDQNDPNNIISYNLTGSFSLLH